MGLKRLLHIIAALLIGATGALPAHAGLAPATAPATMPASSPGVRLGQTARTDGPLVRPLKVVEDSRCPAGVQCIWAGRVRVRTAILVGRRWLVRELELGKPEPVADGTLTLTGVTPARAASRPAPRPRDYRFGFSFCGGF